MAIKTYVHIKILQNFLISSIENWLGDEEAIIQDGNVSYLRTKQIKNAYKIYVMTSEESG